MAQREIVEITWHPNRPGAGGASGPVVAESLRIGHGAAPGSDRVLSHPRSIHLTMRSPREIRVAEPSKITAANLAESAIVMWPRIAWVPSLGPIVTEPRDRSESNQSWEVSGRHSTWTMA